MDTLLATIIRLTEQNVAHGKEPAWPLLRDIRKALPELSIKQILEDASELEEVGRIRVGRTIIDSYFELVVQHTIEDPLCEV